MSTWYERLGAQDRSFLVFDGPTTPMHVAAVTILDAAPLRTADGGIDVERVRAHVAARLHWLPRYRQRVAHIPVFQYPVWVDDTAFDLDYHVRHSSLPRPGSEAQLKRLAARIMAQPLDPSRPLWEMWIIEGLPHDRFALLIKSHHCLVDGTSGVALLSTLMSPLPEAVVEEPRPWVARPAPAPAALLRDEIARQAALPLEVAAQAGRFASRAVDLAANMGAAWSGVRETVAAAWRPPDPTPLNGPVGIARRCDWTRVDLAEAKAIKNRLGGTVNDVIVATVTGALRHYLGRRGLDVERLHLRATVPVSLRDAGEQGPFGNRVSAWLMTLPVGEPDPVRRFHAVRELTAAMKRSSQARVIEALADAAAWIDPIHAYAVRLAARLSPYNLIVTNVVGPGVPLYLLGARMLEAYPLAPLFHNQGLAVGCFSYAGELFLACNADRDLATDLDRFSEALRDAFAGLSAASAADTAPVSARVRPARRPTRAASGRRDARAGIAVGAPEPESAHGSG